ncbi:MAG: 4Fe-4S dicluster domain-containing protein [Deltaproteobacteria bacterium]|nr:4Fe-4S dicluster domain-containing protein [Deltaproteobacteria bacterium]MBW2072236.1 4Fe-4S dicluster domain-containing protein [Deltaproteobacteria bacterium]
MENYTKRVRDIARNLLVEKKVEAVIGFQAGTIPMMSQPVMIRKASEASRMHWDSFCAANLANYLRGLQIKTAVFAKGCDSRNIVVLLQEHQVNRDQLHIIGVPCVGMVDRRKVLAELEGREPTKVNLSEDAIIVHYANRKKSLERQHYLLDNCTICQHRNPVLFDELLAEPVQEQNGMDRYQDIRGIEELDAEQRWQYFQELLAPCIRCYACRNACPMCYCPTCFVDESTPQWLGKTTDPVDTMTFHFLRAYHLAGRCTDCGNCERACPMGIKVRLLTKKLEKDVRELYGYETGLSVDELPPLDRYRIDDPQEFIR